LQIFKACGATAAVLVIGGGMIEGFGEEVVVEMKGTPGGAETMLSPQSGRCCCLSE
jgi:hypothetical protein